MPARNKTAPAKKKPAPTKKPAAKRAAPAKPKAAKSARKPARAAKKAAPAAKKRAGPAAAPAAFARREPYCGRIAPDEIADALRRAAAYVAANRGAYMAVEYGGAEAADLVAAAEDLAAALAAAGGDPRAHGATPSAAADAISRAHRRLHIARDQLHHYARELREADADALRAAFGLAHGLHARGFDGVLAPGRALLRGASRAREIARAADVTPGMLAAVADALEDVERIRVSVEAARDGASAARARISEAWERGERLLAQFRRKTNAAFFDDAEEDARVAGLERVPRPERARRRAAASLAEVDPSAAAAAEASGMPAGAAPPPAGMIPPPA